MIVLMPMAVFNGVVSARKSLLDPHTNRYILCHVSAWAHSAHPFVPGARSRLRGARSGLLSLELTSSMCMPGTLSVGRGTKEGTVRVPGNVAGSGTGLRLYCGPSVYSKSWLPQRAVGLLEGSCFCGCGCGLGITVAVASMKGSSLLSDGCAVGAGVPMIGTCPALRRMRGDL